MCSSLGTLLNKRSS